SPFRSCASLRSLWSAHGGTFTHKSAPMLGAQNNPARVGAGSRIRLITGLWPIKAAEAWRTEEWLFPSEIQSEP
ncbi:hypothetical protein ACFDR9_001614, partial [Janthinobacterium sp. CG_23.3]|uniref:hypothetical protein n=1 Tax=Janthinobacterium sp. CG_23.3 TaxID=3349634 RepID=UPI0038D42C47